MPKPDGTLYRWELAELRQAEASYERAVHRTKMTQGSSSQPYNEAAEKVAFARLLSANTKYGGYRR